NDDIESDIQTFAERMVLAIGKSAESQAFRDMLTALSAAPWRELVEAAIPVFREAPQEILKPKRRDDIVLRLEIYAAYLGNEGAISAMAERCFQKSQYVRNSVAMVDLLRASVGWQSFLVLRRSGFRFAHLSSPQYLRCKGDEIFNVISKQHQT